MSKRYNENQKSSLARAMAAGLHVAKWARKHGVPVRTAHSWARSRAVIDEVDRIRAQVVDRTIGRLTRHATKAADQIATLAAEAQSEAVKLNACRAVLAELLAISNYAALDRRLAEVEGKLRSPGGPPIPEIPPSPPNPTASPGR